ncbi:MAG: 1-acyl-sn-glycerol-3-phosphate acyltransferase [Schleiferiaceae bacterium]|jgi:1-acyl-sn-glycerol-3-phosphate acyltransferase|nr:1-acyl-sn-glycerol-3-phosphate acyltransferase [Schleiferiaceae bacterium]
MKKAIAKFYFWLIGWKINVQMDVSEVKHTVMIAAPHTSNWDFPNALAAFWLMGVDLKFFIKDAYTKSLFGFIFKWMGALGVTRSKKNNLVNHAVTILNENPGIVILVPAEGTRSWVEEWKKGFYHIATEAKVRICLGYLDYKNKIAGIDQILEPTGNIQSDFEIIEKSYQQWTGKNPEMYNPEIFKRE